LLVASLFAYFLACLGHPGFGSFGMSDGGGL
jgi:hypothetical protein